MGARRIVTGDRRALESGFSLIEVLVALMVLAVSLSGAIHVVAQSANMRANLMDRSYAFWTAADVVNRLRLQGAWPAAGEKKSRYEDAAGRMWYGRMRWCLRRRMSA